MRTTQCHKPFHTIPRLPFLRVGFQSSPNGRLMPLDWTHWTWGYGICGWDSELRCAGYGPKTCGLPLALPNVCFIFLIITWNVPDPCACYWWGMLSARNDWLLCQVNGVMSVGCRLPIVSRYCITTHHHLGYFNDLQQENSGTPEHHFLNWRRS